VGRRGRAAGITNAAVRAARAAVRETDERGSKLASAVYAAFVTERELPPSGLPLEVAVLVGLAADSIAGDVARQRGLPTDEETVAAVALYLEASFRGTALAFDREHFERWRAEMRDAAAGGV
jgi:hypothetical protein